MVKSLFTPIIFFDLDKVVDYRGRIEDAKNDKEMQKIIAKLKQENDATRNNLVKNVEYQKLVLKNIISSGAGNIHVFQKRIQQYDEFLQKMNTEFWIVSAKYAQQKNEIIKTQQQQVNIVQKQVKEKREEYKDKRYEISWNQDGSIKEESLRYLLADLDGMSGVEGKNVSWFRQVLFGAGPQQYVIGEQQLLREIQHLNKNQLNALYQRITRDGTDIMFTRSKDVGVDDKDMIDDKKLDNEAMRKIENFRKKIIEKVSVVADVSSVLLGDAKARTGLRAVVQGRELDLLNALNNPANAEKYVKILAERGIIKGEKNIFQTIGNILLNLGLNIGARIASLGTLSGYVENGQINHKKLTSAFSLANASATKTIGENGGSVTASLDGIGARIEASWNDPEARMKVAYNEFLKQSDKVAASQKLVDTWNSKLTSKTKKSAEIRQTGVDFLARQREIMNEYNKVARKTSGQMQAVAEVMNKNALDYIAQVEKLWGTRLKGIFANANLAGFGIGLNNSRINVTAISEGLQIGAGQIEAEALGPEKLTEAKLSELLQKMWITREGNAYFQDGKKIVGVAPGKKIRWEFETINTPNGMIYNVKKFSQVNENQRSFLVNKIFDNVDIKQNSKLFSNLAYRIGQIHKKDYPRMTAAIHSGNYEEAANVLNKILNEHRSSADRNAVNIAKSALQKARGNAEKTEEFMRQFLEKTSGGHESRKIADKLLKGDSNAINELRNYYNKKVGSTFGKMFGIDKSQVMWTLDGILQVNKNPKVSTLNTHAEGNYFGAVTYAQSSRNHRELGYINHNTQIIGNPIDITDASVQNSVKQKLIPILQRQYPNATPADIQEVVNSGKLKATLSFVDNSQCFNLIFFVDSVKKELGESVVSSGSIVGKKVAHKTEAGIAVGMQWWSRGEKWGEWDNISTEPVPDPKLTKPVNVATQARGWVGKSVNKSANNVVTQVVTNAKDTGKGAINVANDLF